MDELNQEFVYWIKEDNFKYPDTILFDVDGVLIDDTISFRKAIISTVVFMTA